MRQIPRYFALFIFILPNLGFGQTNCRNLYIWDFKTEKNERNDITRDLTNEVEDIFSQINDCLTLQRRQYPNLKKHVESEIAISNLEGIPSTLQSQLQTIEAERVLFGIVEIDNYLNTKIRIRIEHLATKSIRTTTIMIDNHSMIDPLKRQSTLRKGIYSFLDVTSSSRELFDKSFLERILSDDCTAVRAAAERIGLYLSTNCSYRVIDFSSSGNRYEIQVHSRGKIWDENFNVIYEIIEPSDYSLLQITK